MTHPDPTPALPDATTPDAAQPEATPRRSAVIVHTGSRLHFGLLTHRPATGREFGGLGVMIDAPGWTIRLDRCDSGECAEPAEREPAAIGDSTGECDQDVTRAREILDRCRRARADRCSNSLSGANGGQTVDAAGTDFEASDVRLTIEASVPGHRGFGSGTQLALAIARGLDVLCGSGDTPVDELARQSGRGLRSAVGCRGFETGGFVVDGGKRHADQIGALIAHLPFPADWRFVLAGPRLVQGMSGDQERAAFRELGSMPCSATDRLCRIALMELLPAVREAEFGAASDALADYGRIVGEYFAPLQGGILADRALETVACELRSDGISGLAQTSWGPTCGILCCDMEMAAAVTRRLEQHPLLAGYELQTVAARNSPAGVETIPAGLASRGATSF